jgi:hypothetical protein
MLELLIKLDLNKIDLLRIRKKRANICVHTIVLRRGDILDDNTGRSRLG